MSEPQVVLWNDDGYDDTSLVELVASVLKIDDPIFLYPRKNRTGHGGFLRVNETIKVQRTVALNRDVLIADGYPAEFPYIVQNLYGPEVIALCVNRGWNTGLDALNSATVMSIMQAMWIGIPGLAISFSSKDHDFDSVMAREKLLSHYLDFCIAEGRSYSINVPDEWNGHLLELQHFNRVVRSTQVEREDIQVYEKEDPVASIFRLTDTDVQSEDLNSLRRGTAVVVDLLEAGY